MYAKNLCAACRPRSCVEAGFRPRIHSFVWFVPSTLNKTTFPMCTTNEWAGVDIRWFPVDGFDTCWIPRSISCGQYKGNVSPMYHCDCLANTGGPSYQGPPLKNSNGAATSSSRRWHLQIWWWHRQSDTLYVVAILSSSLTQMLQLLVTSPCPRRPHPSFHTTAISRFPIFLFNFSLFLVLFLFNCSVRVFSFRPDVQISSRPVSGWIIEFVCGQRIIECVCSDTLYTRATYNKGYI